MVLTSMDLHGDMDHTKFPRYQCLVMSCGFGIITDYGHLRREDAVANAPEVQIGDTIRRALFDCGSQRLDNVLIGLPIE